MASVTTRPHALIIEDELLVGMALQSMLADLGFRSFAFASTDWQALDQARICCPDLVTVDVGLLNGSGPDAIDAVLRDCGPLPVIFITGSPEAVIGRAGAVVLEKPVAPAELAGALAQARQRCEQARRQPRGPQLVGPAASVI